MTEPATLDAGAIHLALPNRMQFDLWELPDERWQLAYSEEVPFPADLPKEAIPKFIEMQQQMFRDVFAALPQFTDVVTSVHPHPERSVFCVRLKGKGDIAAVFGAVTSELGGGLAARQGPIKAAKFFGVNALMIGARQIVGDAALAARAGGMAKTKEVLEEFIKNAGAPGNEE